MAEPLTASDKSGDQISPSTSELDQNANSSAAATTAFSSGCGGGVDNSTAPLLTANNSSTASPTEEEEANRGKKRPNLNLNLNFHNNAAAATESTALKSLRTPDIQQYLNVPWDMPKLKKRVQARRNKFCFSGQASSPETSPQKESLPRSPDVELILRGESTTKDAADSGETWSIIVSNNNNNNNNNNNAKVTLSGGRGKENDDCENAPASLMSTSEDYSADPKNSPSAALPFPRPDERPNASQVKSTRKESSAFIASSSSSGRNGLGLKLSMASRALEGSDSGISMSSQQELLDVPWSMPKHKRKMAASWGRTAEASTGPLVRPSLRLPLAASGKLEQSADSCASKEISCSDDDLDAVEMTKPNPEPEAEDDVTKSSTDSEADLLLQPLPFAMPKLERRLREGAPPQAVPFCRPLELARPGDNKPALQLPTESPFKRGTTV
jgi:hypothetical protein